MSENIDGGAGNNNPVMARLLTKKKKKKKKKNLEIPPMELPFLQLLLIDKAVVFRRAETKEDTFVDAADDMQDNNTDNGSQYADDDVSAAELEKTVADKDSIEEKVGLLRKVAELRRELKASDGKQLPDGEEEETVAGSSVSELIDECLQFVGAALEERLRSESVLSGLHQQIEDVNARNEIGLSVAVVADRMMASLGTVVNEGELLDYSVIGKLAHVEKSTSVLVEQCSWMFNEMEQLRQCLSEGKVQEDFNSWSVFSDAHGELLELKKKEAEMAEKLSYFEDENRKLVEEVHKERAVAESENAELEKVRGELEQERKRSASTKEKLSMAVTKGKALIQQRDSLKQSLAEKTSELDKCLDQLGEKSSAIEAAETCEGELIQRENLVASLQEKLSQRNAILETSVPEGLQSNLEETFSQSTIPKELRAADLNERVRWLINSVTPLEETLSQRNKILDHLNEIVSQINEPLELQSVDTVEKLKRIMALLSEFKNSKSQAEELGNKLIGSQKATGELSAKVKLLEDSLQSRTTQAEIVQERSIFEAPSVCTGSEISEIEDVGSVGKNATSSVPSAAQLQTMRKGSADHLVLNIDSESSSLLNKEKTNKDKGHVFKSLNTSGLIAKQAKSLADQVDGIWVAGGRLLMNRPRTRLGIIAYCLFLHLWLLGTML